MTSFHRFAAEGVRVYLCEYTCDTEFDSLFTLLFSTISSCFTMSVRVGVTGTLPAFPLFSFSSFFPIASSQTLTFFPACSSLAPDCAAKEAMEYVYYISNVSALKVILCDIPAHCTTQSTSTVLARRTLPPYVTVEFRVKKCSDD